MISPMEMNGYKKAIFTILNKRDIHLETGIKDKIDNCFEEEILMLLVTTIEDCIKDGKTSTEMQDIVSSFVVMRIQ